ncbi:zinc transporter [Bacillus salipaludis]|uniref:Zinc transporter n=1 Tax=Bacillus salipaludis TaxID=2547811 RepID=A0A4R5W015_9BACI|nr:ZIP family metal transporter [Bacillus salipaludis]MDQ6596382.1 zinc transporter [Bacillus salipaludis]TDK65137.1 zinc transporter [Bacillus salipaludis]
MIEEIKVSSYVALLIFAALYLGGSSIQFMFLFFKRNTMSLQILCGGFLLGLFTFELLPEAFSRFNIIGILTGISIGIFIMILMEVLLHKNRFLHKFHEDTMYLLFLALLIHSIPTGMTFGMSLHAGQAINYGLLLAFILHNIPEGMIIMASIPFTKDKNKLFIIFCIALSIMIGINIFMGLNMRMDSIKWNTVIMGISIGTIGYVAFYELLWKKSKNLPKGKVVLFVVIGMVGMHFFLRFLPSHH